MSAADAAPAALPPPQTVIRTPSGLSIVSLSTAGGIVETPLELPSVPTGTTYWSPDGLRLAVPLEDSVVVFEGEPLKIAYTIPEKGVTQMDFSPCGTMLVTFRKKEGDEDRNLNVWDAATGALRQGLLLKASAGTAGDWPLLQWTGDEAYAVRVGGDGNLVVYAGDMASAPLYTLPCGGSVSRAWVAPVKPYTAITFSTGKKGTPASVALWRLGATLASTGGAPLAGKSMFADMCRVRCSSALLGGILVEMSTASSGSSYYGDSRLFLFSRDGKVAEAVATPKEGAVHDFAWHPRDESFVVVGGRSPPEASIHDGRTGKAVFSFGTDSWNTVSFQPQGRFLMLAGFGNMAGHVTLWDWNKRKPLCSAFAASYTTRHDWAADGRGLVMAVTNPRMRVDNGYTVFNYRGGVVAHVDYPTLYDAAPRPAPEGRYPDRAATPIKHAPAGAAAAGGAATGGSGAAAAAATAAPTVIAAAPKAAYVPPHLRATGGKSAVAAMMTADKKSAGTIGGPPSTALLGAAPGTKVPVGATFVMSDSAKRRARAQAKKEALTAAGVVDEEEGGGGKGKGGKPAAAAAPAAAEPAPAAAAAAAPAPAAACEPEDPAKEVKRLTKKLRQIEELEALAAGGTALNADQAAKVGQGAGVRARIAELNAAGYK